MPNVFGPLVDGFMVEGAMEVVIRKWLPTYLAEIERRNGLEPQALPEFRSYTSATEFDHFPEEQLPACIIIAPGLLGEPIRSGDGRTMAEWAVGVAVLASGQDRSGSLRIVQLYTAAVRWLVLQHQSLEGFAESVRWIDETYDDMAPETDRTMANGILQFGVSVPNVIDVGRGPRVVPMPDPYTAPPETHTVETVFVQVDSKE